VSDYSKANINHSSTPTAETDSSHKALWVLFVLLLPLLILPYSSLEEDFWWPGHSYFIFTRISFGRLLI
jgi:hypothetical protein